MSNPRPPKVLCPCQKFWRTRTGLCTECKERIKRERKKNGIREDRSEDELGFGFIPPVS